jgi:hypothetical protein
MPAALHLRSSDRSLFRAWLLTIVRNALLSGPL